MANVQSAYAEVSADVLTDSKEVTTSESGYSITYKDGVYTAIINATQKDTFKWTGDTPNISGTSVVTAASWTITGTISSGKVEIKPVAANSNLKG